MDELIKYLNNIVQKLNYRYIMFNVIGSNRELLDFMVELNTIEQLYNKGIDANRNFLGEYSPYTIIIKQAKGQPTNRVTLKDTGEFYESFYATLLADGDIFIGANPLKKDASGKITDLTIEWGKDIIGLTPESMNKLTEKILIEFDKYIRTNLFQI